MQLLKNVKYRKSISDYSFYRNHSSVSLLFNRLVCKESSSPLNASVAFTVSAKNETVFLSIEPNTQLHSGI
jgi:hypothetical protein